MATAHPTTLTKVCALWVEQKSSHTACITPRHLAYFLLSDCMHRAGVRALRKTRSFPKEHVSIAVCALMMSMPVAIPTHDLTCTQIVGNSGWPGRFQNSLHGWFVFFDIRMTRTLRLLADH